MRHGSNIADDSEIEPDWLQRSLRIRAPLPVLYQNFVSFGVAHRLPGCILRNHLRGVRFARAEAHFAALDQIDDVTFMSASLRLCCGTSKHMRDARMNVLAAFGFDDLWLLDVIG